MKNPDRIFSSLATSSAWEKVGVGHHHGINIPLFSIRTEKSSGIGEFCDLIPLINWCNRLGMDVIQLLPLNESGKDPSPYNALSSCALHPIYLSLYTLPYVEKLPNFKKKLMSFHHLNQTKRIAYHKVLHSKLTFLKDYYEYFARDIKAEKEYEIFLDQHKWLLEYALFKVLKEKYDQKHWKDWPEKERDMTKNKFKTYVKTYYKEMEFYFVLQYLCFRQLKAVKAHAEKKNVFLKGDIPILISPDSSDVWAHRSFFDLSFVAGSPPNKFDSNGQYWGFPLYNWKAMEHNHYEWWKKRLTVAEQLYHIYRIDHIIGFFRLWAIPLDHPPSEGYYTPANSAVMRAQGRELLGQLIHFTQMLPIGEDLGIVPAFAKECLAEYGICGTKIFRWEKHWESDKSFIPASQYSPLSMTSVSTHDLDTVRLWWEKNPEEALEYATFKNWTYKKKLSCEQQIELLRNMHHSGSLFHINLLQEYLALTPELTWENPEDERINYPGTIQDRNWTYRYKESLEVLTTYEPLQEYFAKILPQS